MNEVEPNNDYGHANDGVIPGVVYRGTIAKNRLPDEDFFAIEVEAGELYTIRIETDSHSPMVPMVLISSTYFSYHWIVSSSKTTFSIPVLEDGKLFLRISELANTQTQPEGEDPKVYGGSAYSYWFTISRDSFCDKSHAPITTNESLSFSLSPGNMEYFSFAPRTGWHGIESWCGEESESDTWLALFNCTSKLVIAGNDDRDQVSGLLNPWIYREFYNEKNMILITSPIKQDLRNDNPQKCTVRTVAQNVYEELEPNDIFEFANQIEKGTISGYLDEEKHIVDGFPQFDPDYFRFDTTQKHVVTVDINTDQHSEILTELWHFSYNYTSGYYIPLKFNSLEGEGNQSYRLKTFSPFSRGINYLRLHGKNNPYDITIDINPITIKRSGEINETFSADLCSGIVMEWTAPLTPYAAHISVESSHDTLAELHIFADDGSPYTRLAQNEIPPDITLFQPLEPGRLWYFMAFPETCDSPEEQTLTISLALSDPQPITIPFTQENNETDAVVNQTYRGFIDSNSYLVENLYNIIIPEDGVLTMVTAPDFMEEAENINTVLRIFDEDGEEIEENDNAIYNLWYNRYSQIILEVKKDEKYTVSVKPFMDDSSHIPSLNISTHYILDMKLH